jgi:HEAT repeat protein
MGTDATAALAGLLADPNPDVRELAARSLRELGSHAVK